MTIISETPSAGGLRYIHVGSPAHGQKVIPINYLSRDSDVLAFCVRHYRIHHRREAGAARGLDSQHKAADFKPQFAQFICSLLELEDTIKTCIKYKSVLFALDGSVC